MAAPNINNLGGAVLNGPAVRVSDSDEYKKSQHKERSLMLEMVISSLEKTLNRNFEVKDPVIRYTLFIDKLYMIIDTMSSMSDAYLKYNQDEMGISNDHVTRMNKLSKSLQKEMKMLADWVQNPVYSPDHPLGKMMMESAKNDYSVIQGIRAKIREDGINGAVGVNGANGAVGTSDKKEDKDS